MAREGGLGKGLSSLIPQKKSEEKNLDKNLDSKKIIKKKLTSNDFGSEASVKDFKKTSPQKDSVIEVSPNEIKANPFQPRKHFNEEKLEELASSIKKHGVIQPLVVTKRAEGGYELIAGERRFKASQKSGLAKVPVIVKKIGDKEKMEWALIENVQRHDLNAIEEAEAYQNLIDKFGYTQIEVASQVAKSRSTIANTLRLLDLSSGLKKMVRQGLISEGHARALLGAENQNIQEKLAQEIIEKNLSVREVEKKIKNINKKDNRETKDGEKEAGLLEIENRISEALGTKVNIKKGRKGGRFVLNYYSEEEFNNLFKKLTS
jgi:ParB family chromosome partitioning protein